MNRTEALAQFKQELAQAIKEKLSTMSRKEKSDLTLCFSKERDALLKKKQRKSLNTVNTDHLI